MMLRDVLQRESAQIAMTIQPSNRRSTMIDSTYTSPNPDPQSNDASSLGKSPTPQAKSIGVQLEKEYLSRDARWSDHIREHIEREKKAHPERTDWRCQADGTINIPKILDDAKSYTNRGDGLSLDEIRDLLNDTDAGMCTMNGDTHCLEINVRQLTLLLAAYFKQVV